MQKLKDRFKIFKINQEITRLQTKLGDNAAFTASDMLIHQPDIENWNRIQKNHQEMEYVNNVHEAINDLSAEREEIRSRS